MEKAVQALLLLLCILGTSLTCEAEPAITAANNAAIHPVSQTIPEARFNELFLDYIGSQLGKKPIDIVVSKLKVIGNKPVPAGMLSFQAFQKDERQLKGFVRLIGVVRVNGVVKNKVRLSGWVDLFDSVVCVSRNLKRGETIEKGDIHLVRKNVSHLSHNILTQTDKAIGYIAKNNIKRRTCLKESMLERALSVDRGDRIMIVAESDFLKISAPGKALMAGEVGDLIKVENLMSKKNIYAEILDGSTVTVDF